MKNVSVVIPTQGATPLIADCLNSLAVQELKPTEIIVVVNGHNKDLDFIEKLTTIEFSILRSVQNEGFSKAVNKGIMASTAEYVLVLNDDALLDQHCLSALMSAANEGCYGSFAPLIFSLDGSSVQSCGLMFSNAGYGNRSNKTDILPGNRNRDVFCACGAAALYKKSALEDVGLFNKDFFFLFEDLELGFRLQLNNHKCLLVPDARVYHAGGASTHKYFSLQVDQGFANSLSTAFTCMPWEWLAKDKKRMARFYLELFKICWRKGYIIPALNGLARFIFRLPKLMKTRINIQRKSHYDKEYLRKLVYVGDVFVRFPDEELRIRINRR